MFEVKICGTDPIKKGMEVIDSFLEKKSKSSCAY